MKTYQIGNSKARHRPKERESKYQWPADKLTEKEMGILYEWRKKTRMPINLLLAQAVREMDKALRAFEKKTTQSCCLKFNAILTKGR